jgi:hypothetical protein
MGMSEKMYEELERKWNINPEAKAYNVLVQRFAQEVRTAFLIERSATSIGKARVTRQLRLLAELMRSLSVVVHSLLSPAAHPTGSSPVKGVGLRSTKQKKKALLF